MIKKIRKVFSKQHLPYKKLLKLNILYVLNYDKKVPVELAFQMAVKSDKIAFAMAGTSVVDLE